MPNKKFAVISLTVCGRKPHPLKIVQVQINEVTENSIHHIFSSNINPEERTPNYLQQKSGLKDDELLKAPTFLEVAQTLLSILQDYILVGHNVSFLHYALQSEFKYIGYTFKMPQVCTQRLAKKLIPNMVNYELSYLCDVLSIPFFDKYSITDENEADSLLFQRLLQLDEGENHIDYFLMPKIKTQTSLPNSIKHKYIDSLPSLPGIYKFQNSDDEVIYVGKAKNIRKRVVSHFYSTSDKEMILCNATHNIDYELSGSELIALLHEADLIYRLNPQYNYIQKKDYITYHIVPQKNKNGIIQLKIERRPFQHTPTEIFLKPGEAINRLIELTLKFELCPSMTGIKSRLGTCSDFEYRTCKGVCKGLEDIATYNARVENALDFLNKENENYVIFEKGRNREERSFVLILHGVYQGYGFLDNSSSVSSVQDLLDVMNTKKHSYHTAKIILGYKNRNPKKIKHITTENL